MYNTLLDDSLPRKEKALRSYFTLLGESWPLLAFGFVTVFWGNFGQSFFIGWYGASIQESLNLSSGGYGGLYSLATLCSALLIMVFGGAVDRWPLRRFTTSAALGLVAACLALFASHTHWVLLLGLFLVRFCGQGLLPHAAQTTMARYFISHRGKALSLAASGIPAGEVVLPLLAVGLIAWLGWRESWLVIAGVTLLIYLPLIYWLLRRAPVDAGAPPATASPQVLARSAGRRQVLADRRFWLALPALLAGPFLITAVFIQQAFILTQKDWTPQWLATCFVLYGVVHWISSMVVGLLIDRFSACFLLRWMLLPLIAAMFCLSWLEGQWVAPMFMALLGIAIGTANVVGGALWAEVYGTARLGAIRALMTSLMILATAASPLLFGLLIDRGLSLTTLFGATGWLLLGALLLVQFSYKHSARDGGQD